MRFAMVTTYYPPFSYGGDATYVRALARGLVARGHEVEVIASTDAYTMRSPIPANSAPDGDDGVIVHRLSKAVPWLSSLIVQQTSAPGLYAGDIRRILARNFDVIHYHNISLVGGLGVLGMGDPALRLYTLHEHWLFCPAHILWKNGRNQCDKPTCFSCSIRSGIPPQLWRYGSARNRALVGIDRIFSPSRFTADRHRAAGITQPIEVLPLFSNFADGTIAPSPRPARPRFIFVGRVTASKGIDRLLNVAIELQDFDFVVIGEGDQRKRLEVTHRNNANIHFVGHVAQSELAEYYASATALVLPSLAPETFGLGIVEAAQFGTPSVVDAGAGGAAEMIVKTGGGCLYHDEAELIRSLRALAGDNTLRDRLALAARRGYELHYTRDRHFDGYLSQVSGLLAGKCTQGTTKCAQ